LAPDVQTCATALIQIRHPLAVCSQLFFFFYCAGNHRDLHSFPTRRSSDLACLAGPAHALLEEPRVVDRDPGLLAERLEHALVVRDRKSTRLNSSHVSISYAVFCLKKKNCSTRA